VIYELREYTVVPGRMPGLIRRFNVYALKLLAKHDMEVVFISLTDLGDNSNEVVYMLKFDSYGEMAQKWDALGADPEWHAARAECEADGPLVAKLRRRVLSPAAFV
jgi:NIPSNAP